MALPPPIVLRLAKDPLVDKYDLSTVETIVVGAAPTSREVFEEVQARLHIKHLLQGRTTNFIYHTKLVYI